MSPSRVTRSVELGKEVVSLTESCGSSAKASAELEHSHTVLVLPQICSVLGTGVRENVVCWDLNGSRMCMHSLHTSSLLFLPVPCSGSCLTVRTVFLNWTFKIPFRGKKKPQWINFAKGSAVPWECLLLRGWNFGSIFPRVAARPSDIQHSRGGGEKSSTCWFFFAVRKYQCHNLPKK